MSSIIPEIGILASSGLDSQIHGSIYKNLQILEICMEFYFIRHGQTSQNLREGEHKNTQAPYQDPDLPLNNAGRDQARSLAPILAHLPIQTWVTSPLRRTQETLALARGQTAPPIILDDFRECNQEIWDDLIRGGLAPKTLGFKERISRGLETVLSFSSPVLVVGHGGTHLVLCEILGVTGHNPILENAGLVHFYQDPENQWKAKKFFPRALSQLYPSPPPGFNPKVGVSVPVVLCQGRVLLVQKSGDAPYAPNQWSCPGGKVEPGEDPKTGVQRELLEETGLFYPLDAFSPIGRWFVRAASMDFIFHMFLLNLRDQDYPKVTLSSEHKRFSWVDWNDRPSDMELMDGVEEGMEVFLKKSNSKN
jgi:broad specificity phosphatase PhoE/8-oxo-dGTP pyrophosphatase MutT (NUDIX family)